MLHSVMLHSTVLPATNMLHSLMLHSTVLPVTNMLHSVMLHSTVLPVTNMLHSVMLHSTVLPVTNMLHSVMLHSTVLPVTNMLHSVMLHFTEFPVTKHVKQYTCIVDLLHVPFKRILLTKTKPREMKPRLVIIKYAGYVFWQLFLWRKVITIYTYLVSIQRSNRG